MLRFSQGALQAAELGRHGARCPCLLSEMTLSSPESLHSCLS